MKQYPIEVNILRRPTAEDWNRCRDLAMRTIGKKWVGEEVTEAWMHRMLKCRHSPIRTLMFTIELIIPYYVSVHFVRHKFGIEHYVQSQRNDRQSNYDRELAPQNAMVSHTIDVNAEAVMQISNKRLCGQADPVTRYVWAKVCRAIEEVNPEFKGHLVPNCEWLHHCPEFKPCGWWENQCGTDRLEEMHDRLNIHIQIEDHPYIPKELNDLLAVDGTIHIVNMQDLEGLVMHLQQYVPANEQSFPELPDDLKAALEDPQGIIIVKDVNDLDAVVKALCEVLPKDVGYVCIDECTPWPPTSNCSDYEKTESGLFEE